MTITNGLALEPVIHDINKSDHSLFNTTGFTDFIGKNSGKQNTYYKTDKNNFAPNFGVAWSPDYETGVGKFLFGATGKSVLRGRIQPYLRKRLYRYLNPQRGER